MTKSKSSTSSVVLPVIFVTYLMSGAQFLNTTLVARQRPIIEMPPLTKM